MTDPVALAAEIHPRAHGRPQVTTIRYDLAAPALTEVWARALLTEAEIAQAEGYARAEDQRRSRNARALLRVTLSSFVGTPPEQIELVLGAHGKPSVVRGDVRFNMSHSGDRMVVALGFHCDVGVDVELPQPQRDFAGAARFSFSKPDLDALAGVAEPFAQRAFLRLWTAKEAALKALGLGLQRPMRDVVLSDAALGALGADDWRPGAARIGDATLGLYDISAADDVACLAALDQEGGANSAG